MSETRNISALISPPSIATVRSKHGLKILFFGPNGLRAGWRLLLFLTIVAGIGVGLRLIIATLTGKPAPTRAQFSATGEILAAGSTFLLFLLASWIMAKIEGRKIAEYGLPVQRAFRSQFWQGTGIGFCAITLLFMVLRILGAFHFAGIGLHGWDILKYAVLWGITFFTVGLNEEFIFRGYPLFTLSTGMGFWLSAVLMSSLFAFAHYFNPNETGPGLIEVAVWGMMASIILRRTGNLWLPIGLHAGWDWTETYFYGVADSGQVAPGHLLNTSLSGPPWLTGGVAGPEGSWLSIVMLLGLCFLFAVWSPKAWSLHRE